MQAGALTQGFEVDLNALNGDVSTETIVANVLRVNGVNVNQLGAIETVQSASGMRLKRW